ncbi:MAG TPA: hypothetical protein VK453_25110 [Micromonosporaceae bacterium]|nr:hypothetical protein [Micromonosporaceae bacterium]
MKASTRVFDPQVAETVRFIDGPYGEWTVLDRDHDGTWFLVGRKGSTPIRVSKWQLRAAS